MFSRYRNYAGEIDRPLGERERKHLTGLMDEATVVVDKYVDSDPEQARWYAGICERFEGTRVSVVATPSDHALANRVPLDLGAVAGATVDAKLAMAEVVLGGADRVNRRRQGLPEAHTVSTGSGQQGPPGLPRRLAQPPPASAPDGAGVRAVSAQPGPGGTGPAPGTPAAPEGPDARADDSDVRILPAQPRGEGAGAAPGAPAAP